MDRIRAGSVASAFYAARREAIMARQLAAAQQHLFWTHGAGEGVSEMDRGGHHSRWSLLFHVCLVARRAW